MKKQFVFLLLHFIFTSFSQKIELKPHIGFNYVLNKNIEVNAAPINSNKPFIYSANKITPNFGFDIAFVSKKKLGVSLGILYNSNKYDRKSDTSVFSTPAHIYTEDVNVLFPIKAIYEQPLNSGERSLLFSAGITIGFNKFLLNKYRTTIDFPNPVNPFPYYMNIGTRNLSNMKHIDIRKPTPQVGLNIGLEIQPFKHFNGLQFGVEYSLFFTKTMPVIYTLGTITNIDSVNYINPLLFSESYNAQSFISFKLIYNFSFKKKKENWSFNNNYHTIDSSYYFIKKRTDPAIDIPIKALVPTISIYSGLSSSLISNNTSIKVGDMKYYPNSFGYGIQVGLNYFHNKNHGVGFGFIYQMGSFSIATKKSEIAAIKGSYTKWKTTMSQYLFPINYIYRHYYKNNFKHIEFTPAIYIGFNQYFVFSYHNYMIFYSNPPSFTFSQNDDFRYSIAAGFSNSFLIHPFAKNIGLKFGLNYQIDFTRFNSVAYDSKIVFSNGVEENYKATVAPLLSKLHFVVNYSPTIGIKKTK